jgi:hypothetical protein
MQYYKLTVRLGGSPLNEVEKVFSAPEVLISQYIHGPDAIVRVSYAYERTINLREEKDRLKSRYDQALVKSEQSIDSIFGPLGSVPEQLPLDLIERYDIVDEDDIISVAKNVTRMDKRENHSQTMSQAETDRNDRIIPAEEVSLDDLAG